jgi:hypothetical protein
MILRDSVGVRGRYKLTKLSAGGIVLGEWEFDNLVTNYGMDRLGSGGKVTDYCVLGGGSRDPDITNPNIDAFLAARGPTTNSYYTNADINWSLAFWNRYSWPPGTLNNVNITEIGTSPSDNGTNLFSHSKILDDQGNPTTITVLTGESLLVEYTLFTDIDINDKATVVPMDFTGTPADVTVTRRFTSVNSTRVGGTTYANRCGMRGYRGWAASLFYYIISDVAGYDVPPEVAETDVLPPLVATSYGCGIPGDRTECTSYGRSGYEPGSYKRTGWAIWDGAVANYGSGIGSVAVMNTTWFSAAFSFSPKIPKTLGLSLRLDFEMSWYRDGIDNV